MSRDTCARCPATSQCAPGRIRTCDTRFRRSIDLFAQVTDLRLRPRGAPPEPLNDRRSLAVRGQNHGHEFDLVRGQTEPPRREPSDDGYVNTTVWERSYSARQASRSSLLSSADLGQPHLPLRTW